MTRLSFSALTTPFNTLHRAALRLPALLLATLVAGTSTPPVQAAEFVAAGVPRDIASSRNYDAIFQHLSLNGIKLFFPTFQYQEVPAPRSYGFERDFMAPCNPASPAFEALRKTGVKLVVPGELLYPDPARMGRNDLAGDPLTQLIACVGRKNIAAVTNYDEAAMHGMPEAAVEALYNRVKQIAPDLPVLMVHGPITIDKPQFASNTKVQSYLQSVLRYSRHADVIGFDVYPFPMMVAKVATPKSKRKLETPSKTIADYIGFLNANFPDKKTLLVLQGFAYSDLYERSFLEANVAKQLRDLVKAPSLADINMMTQKAVAANVDYIVWWGQAALESTNTAPWPAILQAARQHR